MALLRMLNRSAFICNLCFLIALCILWFKHPLNEGMVSMIIIMGFFLAVLLNILVAGWLIFQLISGKKISGLPQKLLYINCLFLVVQLVILIKK